MKLVMTLVVRDEADIVAVNLRYHLDRDVDLILVTDNGSIDGTRDILAEYARTGQVRVIDEPGDDYQQWRWVTRMARLAAVEYAADWVVHCDADEFWWPDRDDLRDAFTELPPEAGIVPVRRHNFLPTAAEDGPFHQRMVIRDRFARNGAGRPILGKQCHRGHPEVWVAQGNHDVQAYGLARYPGTMPVTILHYPLRTYAQFERKVVLGGRAYARNTELGADIGAGWRELYKLYLAGRLRDYYDEQVPDAGGLLRGVMSGRFVVDRRLQAFLRSPAPDRRVERPAVACHDGDHARMTATGPPAVLPAVLPAASLAWRSAVPSAVPPVGVAPPSSSRAAVEAVGVEAVGVVAVGVEVLASSPRTGQHAGLEARLADFIDGARESLACAAFDLRATAVAAALRDAVRRGVDVRVACDPAGDLPEREGADPKPAGTVEVLRSWLLPARAAFNGGTGPAGALHHRFLVRDGESVWTGSASLSPDALHRQDNDCLVIHSPAVARGYLDTFARLTRQQDTPAGAGAGAGSCRAALPDGEVCTVFAPGTAVRDVVVDLLATAHRVRLATYQISDPPILTALRRRREAGADIAGVYDPHGMASVLRASRRDRRQFWFLTDPRFAAAPSHAPGPGGERDSMNSKLLIVDDSVAVTGSYNFSCQGTVHAESVVVIRSPSVVAHHVAYWQRLACGYGLTAAD
jgi:phosphatidylserine/phosphatidylglycerophosphate/cardiolipin synthase-like enzyme